MTHLAIEELPEDARATEVAEAVTDAEYETGNSNHGREQTEATPPVSRVTVMDQKLPEPLATQRVEVRRISIAPGYAAGLHVHNGPVFGSIETGSVVYQVEGEPENMLEAGDVFYEPSGVRIARFDAGQDGVTFIGYFLLPDGVNAELFFPEV
jgi:quercetin dioxygenase-like cupin family protein